jgi:hypothetical protein
MFRGSRAFRLGESGRLSPDFVVACAAAGVLVLHKVSVPMRLNTPVALCVPKAESHRAAYAKERSLAAFTAGGKQHTTKLRRLQNSDITRASTHLQGFPN